MAEKTQIFFDRDADLKIMELFAGVKQHIQIVQSWVSLGNTLTNVMIGALKRGVQIDLITHNAARGDQIEAIKFFHENHVNIVFVEKIACSMYLIDHQWAIYPSKTMLGKKMEAENYYIVITEETAMLQKSLKKIESLIQQAQNEIQDKTVPIRALSENKMELGGSTVNSDENMKNSPEIINPFEEDDSDNQNSINNTMDILEMKDLKPNSSSNHTNVRINKADAPIKMHKRTEEEIQLTPLEKTFFEK